MLKKAPLILLLFGLILSLGMVFPVQGAPDNRLRVAIIPFDDGSIQGRERWWGHRWEVGRGVADELVTALFNTGKFRLIEREQIQEVLDEQHLGYSGQIDSRTAARLGKILGVQVLIMGKVTEFATDSKGASIFTPQGFGFGIKASTARVTLDARMVDTTSAEIIAIATGKGEKKQTSLGLRVDFNHIAFGSDEFRKTDLGVALKDAVAQLAEQLAAKAPLLDRPAHPRHEPPRYGHPRYEPPRYGHPPVPPPPPPPPAPLVGRVTTVNKNQVYINIEDRKRVRPGMKFKVYRVIDTVNDPKDGKVLLTEPIAKITVTAVKLRSIICKVDYRIDSKATTAVNDFVRESE
jgi:curli biogenesis system outer membrane secretion channel CsgG